MNFDNRESRDNRERCEHRDEIFEGAAAYARTDLACEAGRPETTREESEIPLGQGNAAHLLRCVETDGRHYVTVSCGKVTLLGGQELDTLSRVLSEEMTAMACRLLGRDITSDVRILVAGLGNPDMTADAIGPFTVRHMTATRHLKYHDEAMYTALGCCELSAVSPGVLGQTGIESAELVKGAVRHVRPHLVVAVDALAARSCERLASTIQLSDGGIGPGTGVGNHRMAIDKEHMGCPVLGVGMPTVVDSSTLVYDALAQAGIRDGEVSKPLRDVLENGRRFVVSPRDCDRITEVTCRLLAKAIDLAFGVVGM